MGNKGLTLVEVIIVVVIIGIISAFAVPAVSKYLRDAQESADEHNIEVLEEVIVTAFADGTLILKNNKVFNTVSNRSYSGTGKSFKDDMVEYLPSRVFPMIEEARNEYNYAKAYDDYKFLFRIEGSVLHVIYYDHDRNEVIMTSIDTSNLEVN